MPNKITYEFAVIRLVPKVEREEFINIGVIVFSKRKRYLGMKYLIDQKKVQAISSDVNTEMIAKYLAAWERVCRGNPEGGFIGSLDIAYRFRWLTADKSSIIQCSKTHPGLCENPEEILECIFERFVL